jgi:prepilin-type N-terminal cleavage/methylation domain-containing protein
MKSQQSGFTLVEIAIVLVIIGLLLGGILKGQELINSARVKNLANDFRVIPTYIYAYQDRYRALPGDQTQAQLDTQFQPNGTATPAAAGTFGNGRIDGIWSDTGATSEAAAFWQHIRLANLAAGPTATADANYTPRNAVNGIMGVQSGPVITGMTGTYSVCSAGILGRYAKQLDVTMDDGNPATGSLRVTAAATGTGLTAMTGPTDVAYTDDATFTVCMMF